MKVPYSWLAEYIDLTGLTPQQVSDGLTNAGLEVEEIESLGPVFKQVVVAKVLSIAPHPNADKLRLVHIDAGASGQFTVVCGAPNVRADIRIAFALNGATVLNRKTNETFVLGPATIRGVESSGMVCSIDELGLNEKYNSEEDGIWVLDSLTTDAQVGQPLETVLGLPNDTILHVMPTANRGDWMSILGVAREVAAVFGRQVKLPQSLTETLTLPSKKSDIQVALPDTSLSRYYAMGQLTGAKIAPSPDWLKARLTAAGIRCINNVVDVTNYVMLTTGQPMHAFDQGKLAANGTISVRRTSTQQEERLLTLDGQDLQLCPENVLITFNDKPVALAGVMGGEESAINDDTSSVILEVAYFPSASTRRSARASGIRSESSARFERGIDPLGQEQAFAMAVSMIQELSGATLDSVCIADKREKTQASIILNFSNITKTLGIKIPRENVVQSLTALGFAVTENDAESLLVTVPSPRLVDVAREIDLIEEVIRIYGYDHLPLTLPMVNVTPESSFRQLFLELVRRELQALGLSEAMTLSLVAEAKSDAAIKLINSHSREHVIMRETLLDGFADIAEFNVAQGNKYCWLFELGRQYRKTDTSNLSPKQTGVSEALYLAGALYGIGSENDAHLKPVSADFYTAKGVLDGLFKALGIASSIKYAALNATSDNALFHPGRSAEIKLGKTPIGVLGQYHPLLADDAKLKHPLLLFELNLELILAAAEKAGLFQPLIQPISPFPTVERDIALMAPLELTHQKILAAIRQLNQALLLDITLFDEYQGAQIEAGHRSLAYRLTLGASDRTLTDAEIDAVVTQVKEALSTQLSVQAR